VGALDEAVAHSRGELSARVDRVEVTARSASVARPPKYSAHMIRELRRGLGVSQPVFAGMLNVSGSTVQAWEQGTREPDGPSLRLLEVATKHPKVLLADVSRKRSGSNKRSEQP
ncbi:MAG TPA: helix-turn-helix domain-containing protein, partial [Longimicrobium sp.]|nr:helix-turn-helix domain-containing protein [Longimicrobium sp.]